MSSEYGNKLKISVFGQSHGRAIGVLIDGLPAGEEIDMEALYAFMKRRAPGGSELTTKRSEDDVPVFLSGIENGRTCGFPVCAVIENRDIRSSDYSGFSKNPRPSHADYTALVKYGGCADLRGGGHFSGRLTAPLCIAGGISRQILERKGIYIGAHLLSVGGKTDKRFPLKPDSSLFKKIEEKDLPVICDECGKIMAEEIRSASAALDSVGAAVECAITGVPAGIGAPLFGGIESRISQAVFGIPAVKGIEFGSGFSASGMRGSENNDPFAVVNGRIETVTNNCGGILGGISTGMPIVFTTAFKPTPSIGTEQDTVDTERMENTKLTIKGRHDPCVAVRAVPVVEAVAATVILDMLLEDNYGS